MSHETVLHQPWRGNNYCSTGIEGQRVAIVGFSHYDTNGLDDADFTIDIVRAAMSGELPGRARKFFTSIRNYFDFQDHADFWDRVVFFNYIPNSIGDESQRYADGTTEQHDHAKERFFQILKQNLPHKVFVFSTKAGNRMPPSEEGAAEYHETLKQQISCRVRTYRTRNHVTRAFLLRHPQGARGPDMHKAVEAAMRLPNGDFLLEGHNKSD